MLSPHRAARQGKCYCIGLIIVALDVEIVAGQRLVAINADEGRSYTSHITRFNEYGVITCVRIRYINISSTECPRTLQM